MDHAVSQILDACNLVKELEHIVQNANALSDTRLLLESSEAIVAAFERPIPLLRYQLAVDGERGDVSMRGEADAAFFGNAMADSKMSHEAASTVMAGLEGGFMFDASDPAVGATNAFTGGGGEKPRPVGEGSSSGRRPAVQKSPKKRKEEATVITVRMPLRADGNKDTPPYDGYMWRKYGRKDILNSTFRRNYYRCAYKSYFGCPARKYVQRLDKDPDVFEVIYIGEHTCNISQTPFSIPPFAVAGGRSISYDLMNQQAAGAASLMPQHPEQQRPNSWLLMGQQPHERNTVQQGGEGSGRAGEQLSRNANRDVDFPNMNLADIVFNSDGSVNSIDAIFGSKSGV